MCVLIEDLICIKIHKNYIILDVIRIDETRENVWFLLQMSWLIMT